MGELRRLLVALVAVVAVAAPAAAQDDGPDAADETIVADSLVPRLLTAQEYLDLYDDADLRGVTIPSPEVVELFGPITGNPDTDARIRSAAEARGYRVQPLAVDTLVPVDGRRLQATAAEAWDAMRDAARADGVSLILTSAHRSPADQRSLFLGRLGGATSDAAIDAALRFAAPPGYSKHQSGFAIDVGQPGTGSSGFASTRAYAWLSIFDFANAKRFGFVPSYPVGGSSMGPDPEAWEFVWVGAGRIACLAAGDDPAAPFCDTAGHARAADVAWLFERGVTVGCAPGRFCVDDLVTRGEAAAMIWRLHGAPEPVAAAPFADVFVTDAFAPAVAWLHESRMVNGTSATTFSPDDPLTPAAALALLVRFEDRSDLPAPIGLLDTAGVAAEASPGIGDLGDHVTRAEFASVLRNGLAP